MVLGHGILSALNKTIGFYPASRGTSLLVPVKAGIMDLSNPTFV
jgi:hypothetical protein